MDLNGQNRMLWWKFDQSIFKEVIFVWLEELDNLDYDIHVWIRIHIQSHVSAENIVLNGLSEPWQSEFLQILLLNSSNKMRIMKK